MTAPGSPAPGVLYHEFASRFLRARGEHGLKQIGALQARGVGGMYRPYHGFAPACPSAITRAYPYGATAEKPRLDEP
jgi:hypothetical protein